MNSKKLAFIGLAIVIVFLVFLTSKSSNTEISHFSSEKELRDYLASESKTNYQTYGVKSSLAGGVAEASDSSAPSSASARDYSQTNVQVQGVDEPDLIKTDGNFIYVLSNNNLSIIDVSSPENAKIISTISLNGYSSEFLIQGDKLVIFNIQPFVYSAQSQVIDSILPPKYEQNSQILVYDISDRSNPKQVQNIEYDGSYYDARLIGSYVYVIVNQPLNLDNGGPMPLVKYDGVESKIAATDIAYWPIHDSSYQLTTVFAVNLENEEIARSSFLTGYTQTIYVSENNIYLTSQKYISYEEQQLKLIEKALLSLVKGSASNKIKDVLDSKAEIYDKQREIQSIFEDYYNSLSQDEKDKLADDLEANQKQVLSEIQKETQRTTIHKISINQENIEYQSKGEVPGILLNQFSLDEYNGDLRVATTTGDTWSASSLNHVYVLDDSLNIIGRVEDLAQGESIYSARFMQDRVYLVTFRQIDPLFVIDLSNPSRPQVLGELKIPGYSSYLHPYDENHIIGLGKDTEGDFNEGGINAAITAGLKIALFDVSDPSNPIEVDSYAIGSRGSESTALWDHHAFLFDKSKNLLVLPVSVRDAPRSGDRWAYGPLVFDGVYVFNLDENGFSLKTKVTHLTPSEQSNLKSQGDYAYAPWDAQIQRSLYVRDTLYTMSQRSLKATSLTSYEDLNTINLPRQVYDTGQGLPLDAGLADVTTKA